MSIAKSTALKPLLPFPESATSYDDLSTVALSIPSMIERRKKALTAIDLAEFMPMKPNTFTEWAREGRMPAMRVNGCVLFDPKTTAAWLRERMTTGKGKAKGR